jgi:hypothetical protein
MIPPKTRMTIIEKKASSNDICYRLTIRTTRINSRRMVSRDILAVVFMFVSHYKCCKTEDHEDQKTFPSREDWRDDLGCDFNCECDVFHNSDDCRLNEWTGQDV